MKELLYEIFNEAKDASIMIDDEKWPIAFNTKIYEDDKLVLNNYNDNNLSTLEINNLDLFIDKINEYLECEKTFNRKCLEFYKDKEHSKEKFLISYLFVNATTEDFKEPIRYIEYLRNNTLDDYNEEREIALDEPFLGSKLSIKNEKQSVMMETPNKISLSIKDSDDEFILPEISYGIEDNTCYIYSILNKNTSKEESTKYQKKINRLLYKINNNVLDNESDEFKEYKEKKSTYYPENISDVSVSSVLSLSIFLNLLKNKNINTVKAVPYLPLRYLSRDLVAQARIDETDLHKRNDKIQSNITDKFIRTFRRVSSHLDFINIQSYPYEVDEYLTLKINNSNIKADDLLNNVNKAVDNKIR